MVRKKLLVVIMVTITFMLLIGCSQNKADGNKDVENNASNSKEDDEVNLFIVRHGKTMLNATDRVQGWSDAVLTPDGEDVLQSAGKGLKDKKFSAVYSSDSGRAIQTADIILEENGESSDLNVETDERLREFNFGSYEGDLNETMWTDIAEDEGKTLKEWQDEGMDPENFANGVAELDKENVKGGENWPAEDYNTITDRLTEAINEIAENESEKGGGNILITSHGLSIGALLDTMFDDVDLPDDGLDNASVSTINYKDGDFELVEVNDTSYIEEGEQQ